MFIPRNLTEFAQHLHKIGVRSDDSATVKRFTEPYDSHEREILLSAALCDLDYVCSVTGDYHRTIRRLIEAETPTDVLAASTSHADDLASIARNIHDHIVCCLEELEDEDDYALQEA